MKKLLTLREAAEISRVLRMTYRKWIERGIAPGIKLGNDPQGEWRVDEDELAAWLKSRSNKALTPEQLAVTLAAPNGRVKEEQDGSLPVNVGWPEEK